MKEMDIDGLKVVQYYFDDLGGLTLKKIDKNHLENSVIQKISS